jgi:hypothetical protein
LIQGFSSIISAEISDRNGSWTEDTYIIRNTTTFVKHW